MQTKKLKKLFKVVPFFALLLASFLNFGLIAHAEKLTDFSPAEDAGKWFTKQVGWLAIAGTLWVVFKLGVARNVVAAGIVLVAGGVISYFCFNPEKIRDIGDLIAPLLGL